MKSRVRGAVTQCVTESNVTVTQQKKKEEEERRRRLEKEKRKRYYTESVTHVFNYAGKN